jgi:hypothetical protein
MIGIGAGSTNQELLFRVVSSEQIGQDKEDIELVMMVPKDWVDVDCRYVLHPHPDQTVQGLYTWEWPLISFKKRRYPEMTMVEYEIMDLITECPGWYLYL